MSVARSPPPCGKRRAPARPASAMNTPSRGAAPRRDCTDPASRIVLQRSESLPHSAPARRARTRVPRREEPHHVDRPRRILADDRRRGGAHVSEAREVPSRLVAEVLRSLRRVERRDRVVVERLAHRRRKVGAGAEVPGFGRIVRQGRRPRSFRRRSPSCCPRDRHDLRLPAVAEKRLHRLAEHDFLADRSQTVGRSDPGEIEKSVEDAPGAHRHVARLPPLTPGPTITSGTSIVGWYSRLPCCSSP